MYYFVLLFGLRGCVVGLGAFVGRESRVCYLVPLRGGGGFGRLGSRVERAAASFAWPALTD